MIQTIHCQYWFEHEACLVGEAARFATLKQAMRDRKDKEEPFGYGKSKAGRFAYMLNEFAVRPCWRYLDSLVPVSVHKGTIGRWRLGM